MTSDKKVISARGILRDFCDAGLLEATDIHIANLLLRTGNEKDEWVGLAAALTMRALRAGSVCLRLAQARSMAQFLIHDDSMVGSGSTAPSNLDLLPWPDPDEWLTRVKASGLVGDAKAEPNCQPLRCVNDSLYLERYWQDQESIRTLLLRRLTHKPFVDETTLIASLDSLFRGDAREIDQQHAVETAVHQSTAVITGGPGTGKTHTIAAIVSAMQDQAKNAGQHLSIALAAPTGKAAARLTEEIQKSLSKDSSEPSTNAFVPQAVTLHRLLGARPDRPPRFNAQNKLPYDLVVVDEMSMVSLSLMARLLEAISDHTRLIMLGDANQLTPVDAGAVLADITAAGTSDNSLAQIIVELKHGFRFDSSLAQLADAIRCGDATRALKLLTSSETDVTLQPIDPAELVATPEQVSSLPLAATLRSQAELISVAATHGDGKQAVEVLSHHRVLCAHRNGPYGVNYWARLVESIQRPLLGTRPTQVPSVAHLSASDWYAGRPVLATRNIPELEISNGDTGIVIDTPAGMRAAMSNGREYQPDAVNGLETMFAMTVHKSQGSQFNNVTVVLPPPDSPLLTRELLYTAVTRARNGVQIIGTPESVIAAVETPARRASGLTARLRQSTE